MFVFFLSWRYCSCPLRFWAKLVFFFFFGLWCKILGGGPATNLVHVFDYPFEESDVEIEHALADFGEIKKGQKADISVESANLHWYQIGLNCFEGNPS